MPVYFTRYTLAPGILSGTVLYRIFAYILSNHLTNTRVKIHTTVYLLSKPFDCQWHSPYYCISNIKPIECQWYSTYYIVPTLKSSAYYSVPTIKPFDCQRYSTDYSIPTIKSFEKSTVPFIKCIAKSFEMSRNNSQC